MKCSEFSTINNPSYGGGGGAGGGLFASDIVVQLLGFNQWVSCYYVYVHTIAYSLP